MKIMKRLLVFVLALGMLVTALPVADAQTATINVKTGKTVSKTCYAGKTRTLKISGVKEADVQQTSWKSSNSSVAKITSKSATSAKIKLRIGGKATITATVRFKDGTAKKYTCKITAKDPTVTVEPATAQLAVGDTKALAVVASPVNGVLALRTDNDDVAVVNDDGIVTAVGVGKAKITVTVTYGTRTVRATMKVSVQAKPEIPEPETTQPEPEPETTQPEPETTQPEPEAVASYAVTFNSCGGSNVTPQTVENGSKATKPEDPTRDGYKFDGWFTAADGGEQFGFDAAVTADVTLYAHWTAVISYTVTFNENYSLGGIQIVTVHSGDTVPEPASPERASYIFKGWYTAVIGGKRFDFKQEITANITLYAKWDYAYSTGITSGGTPSGTESSSVGISACFVAADSNELRDILADPATSVGETVGLKTGAGGTITIPADIGGAGRTLVIDAPNATVVNNESFAKVLIQEIALNTYVENAPNSVEVNAANAHVQVNAAATITVGSTSTTEVEILPGADGAVLENLGQVSSLTINTSGTVTIGGNSAQGSIPTIISGQAVIYTTRTLTVNAESPATLILRDGAEGTTVSVTDESNCPTVQGLGMVVVMVNGEETTIYAEPETDPDVPAVTISHISGMVLNSSAQAVSGAAIYLEPYRRDFELANLTSAPAAWTDDDGAYLLSGTTAGNYFLCVMKDGYVSEIQTLILTSAQANGISNNDIILLAEGEIGTGSIRGKIIDSAMSGEIGVPDITVFIRKGQNSLTGEAVAVTTTDGDGNYSFGALPLGNYTIQAVGSGYISVSRNVFIGSANNDRSVNIGISTTLADGLIRFVLTWADEDAAGRVSSDLDSHLNGPDGNGGTFHVYYEDSDAYDGNELIANLDRDDVTYMGPETTTIYVAYPGLYYFSIHDFSYRDETESMHLADSQAHVDIYVGNSLRYSYTAPYRAGTLWHVCVYDSRTGIFTPLDTMSYESNPEDVIN